MSGLNFPTKTATIAISGTTSSAIEIDDQASFSLDVPTLTSGTFKVQGSLDGGTTFRDIYDEFANPVLQYPVGTGAFCIGARAMENVRGFSHIQFVTGAAQGAARTITLYMRR